MQVIMAKVFEHSVKKILLQSNTNFSSCIYLNIHDINIECSNSILLLQEDMSKKRKKPELLGKQKNPHGNGKRKLSSSKLPTLLHSIARTKGKNKQINNDKAKKQQNQNKKPTTTKKTPPTNKPQQLICTSG